LKSTETLEVTATRDNGGYYFSNFGSLKSTETDLAYENAGLLLYFSNFGSLKSTETISKPPPKTTLLYFSNFGSLKSTETAEEAGGERQRQNFSNFGSLKSTETYRHNTHSSFISIFQQFRLVEEH